MVTNAVVSNITKQKKGYSFSSHITRNNVGDITVQYCIKIIKNNFVISIQYNCALLKKAKMIQHFNNRSVEEDMLFRS